MKLSAKRIFSLLFASIIGSIPVLGVQAATITAETEKQEIQWESAEELTGMPIMPIWTVAF